MKNISAPKSFDKRSRSKDINSLNHVYNNNFQNYNTDNMKRKFYYNLKNSIASSKENCNLTTEKTECFEEKYDLDMFDFIDHFYKTKYKPNNLIILNEKNKNLNANYKNSYTLIATETDMGEDKLQTIKFKNYMHTNSNSIVNCSINNNIFKTPIMNKQKNFNLNLSKYYNSNNTHGSHKNSLNISLRFVDEIISRSCSNNKSFDNSSIYKNIPNDSNKLFYLEKSLESISFNPNSSIDNNNNNLVKRQNKIKENNNDHNVENNLNSYNENDFFLNTKKPKPIMDAYTYYASNIGFSENSPKNINEVSNSLECISNSKVDIIAQDRMENFSKIFNDEEDVMIVSNHEMKKFPEENKYDRVKSEHHISILKKPTKAEQNKNELTIKIVGAKKMNLERHKKVQITGEEKNSLLEYSPEQLPLVKGDCFNTEFDSDAYNRCYKSDSSHNHIILNKKSKEEKQGNENYSREYSKKSNNNENNKLEINKHINTYNSEANMLEKAQLNRNSPKDLICSDKQKTIYNEFKQNLMNLKKTQDYFSFINQENKSSELFIINNNKKFISNTLKIDKNNDIYIPDSCTTFLETKLKEANSYLYNQYGASKFYKPTISNYINSYKESKNRKSNKDSAQKITKNLIVNNRQAKKISYMNPYKSKKKSEEKNKEENVLLNSNDVLNSPKSYLSESNKILNNFNYDLILRSNKNDDNQSYRNLPKLETEIVNQSPSRKQLFNNLANNNNKLRVFGNSQNTNFLKTNSVSSENLVLNINKYENNNNFTNESFTNLVPSPKKHSINKNLNYINSLDGLKIQTSVKSNFSNKSYGRYYNHNHIRAPESKDNLKMTFPSSNNKYNSSYANKQISNSINLIPNLNCINIENQADSQRNAYEIEPENMKAFNLENNGNDFDAPIFTNYFSKVKQVKMTTSYSAQEDKVEENKENSNNNYVAYHSSPYINAGEHIQNLHAPLYNFDANIMKNEIQDKLDCKNINKHANYTNHTSLKDLIIESNNNNKINNNIENSIKQHSKITHARSKSNGNFTFVNPYDLLYLTKVNTTNDQGYDNENNQKENIGNNIDHNYSIPNKDDDMNQIINQLNILKNEKIKLNLKLKNSTDELELKAKDIEHFKKLIIHKNVEIQKNKTRIARQKEEIYNLAKMMDTQNNHLAKSSHDFFKMSNSEQFSVKYDVNNPATKNNNLLLETKKTKTFNHISSCDNSNLGKSKSKPNSATTASIKNGNKKFSGYQSLNSRNLHFK